MKVILNILTHGDETVGLKVAKEIQKLRITKGELIVHRANKLAYTRRKRFIDQDLNRSFPGDAKGNHEQRLAHKIFPLIKSADIVIDIHSTTSGLKDALIVTRVNKAVREYVEVIAPRYLLYMRATRNNALMSEAKVGIAFEYGSNADKEALREINNGIKRLLSHLGMIEEKTPKKKRKVTWLDVYSMVSKKEGAKLLKSVKNYKLIMKGTAYGSFKGEDIRAAQDFYPILFGEKNYNDMFGFAARPYQVPRKKN